MSNKEPLSFDVSKVEEKLKNVKSLSDLTGSNGVIQEIIKGTVERILKAEQEAHLGYEPYKKGSMIFPPKVTHSETSFGSRNYRAIRADALACSRPPSIRDPDIQLFPDFDSV